MNLLQPEYNILKEPGSSLGRLHSEQTKEKMSAAALGRKYSEETRSKMSDAQKGIPKPKLKGIPKSEEIRAKISTSLKGILKSEQHKTALAVAMVGNTNSKNHPNSQKIEVQDLQKNQKITYDSIHEAARALDIRQCSISKYFFQNQKKPFKGRYIFQKI
jgi:group I intron endonuclease